MSSRLIEQTFPIREISELAIPERSSYKPIYQISKWFARRSSSTFRALLLGALLPPSADLMANFYSDHDFSDVTVIDPFVGGGRGYCTLTKMSLHFAFPSTAQSLLDLSDLQS